MFVVVAEGGAFFFIAREERWLGEKTTGGKYEIAGE